MSLYALWRGVALPNPGFFFSVFQAFAFSDEDDEDAYASSSGLGGSAHHY
jgi:hypothetical protein